MDLRRQAGVEELALIARPKLRSQTMTALRADRPPRETTRPPAVVALAEINITPLVDMMQVLLIIFMVVTPLAKRGLDVALPEPPTGPAPVPPPPPLVLSLDESGMSLNRTPVATLDELAARLGEIFEARTDRTLFIRSSDAMRYGAVVQALDVAPGAGTERIGIILVPGGQGEAPGRNRISPQRLKSGGIGNGS